MPERLDRVAIATSRTTIELPWGSRDRLLHEIRNLAGADTIRTAFDAVGASRPVPLSRADEIILFNAINEWSRSVTVDGLPAGVWELRCALADEFADKPDPAAEP
jgi:hypothetical protein